MGTFLKTQIITEFQTYISSDKKNSKTTKAVADQLAKAMVVDPEIFTVEEKDGYYNWKLKTDILKDNLQNFLSAYYKDMYADDRACFENDCTPVLEFLHVGNPTDEAIWNYLENSRSHLFISGRTHYSLSIADEDLDVSADTIILSYEGKVMYEEINT